MPRKCTICADKNRCAIDQCVVSGEPIRRIASHFGVGEKSLERHVKAGHVSDVIKSAANDNNVINGKSLQQKIEEAYNLSLEAAQIAKKTDIKAFGGCIGGVMKALEIEARIMGIDPPEGPKKSGFMAGYLKRAKESHEGQTS